MTAASAGTAASSYALIGRHVELERATETKWVVRYGSLELGRLNAAHLNQGIIPKSIRAAEVSGMSVAPCASVVVAQA